MQPVSNQKKTRLKIMLLEGGAHHWNIFMYEYFLFNCLTFKNNGMSFCIYG